MLAKSRQPNAEEYAIHDYSGFAGWRPSEFASMSDVHTVANAIEDHGEAVTHWIDYLGDEPERAIDSFEDAYLGAWSTLTEYAEALAEDVGLTISVEPASWESYVRFDANALARDLDIELHVAEAQDGDVHVFNPLAVDG